MRSVRPTGTVRLAGFTCDELAALEALRWVIDAVAGIPRAMSSYGCATTTLASAGRPVTREPFS